MFRIGEFSKIAQVSGRLLRYYAEIGLLAPIYIDPETGYRFYTAEQLPRLNRILALKDLGLALEQIARLVNEQVSADEIRGMLTIRKSQIEQTLQDEIGRLRMVENRLQQIEQEGSMWSQDVIIKSVPNQLVLSIREVGLSNETVMELFNGMQRALPSGQTRRRYGLLFFIMHSDTIEDEGMDLEFGFLLNSTKAAPLQISDAYTLTQRELPSAEMVASIVYNGWEGASSCYNALGAWIEAHQYKIAGPGREIILKSGWPDAINESILEIQFPIQHVKERELNNLSK